MNGSNPTAETKRKWRYSYRSTAPTYYEQISSDVQRTFPNHPLFAEHNGIG